MDTPNIPDFPHFVHETITRWSDEDRQGVLNNAVYLMEDFLESTTEPNYAGVVEYGDRAEHCWNGDHENGNYLSRLRYNTMYLPLILERLRESAPPGSKF